MGLDLETEDTVLVLDEAVVLCCNEVGGVESPLGGLCQGDTPLVREAGLL